MHQNEYLWVERVGLTLLGIYFLCCAGFTFGFWDDFQNQFLKEMLAWKSYLVKLSLPYQWLDHCLFTTHFWLGLGLFINLCGGVLLLWAVWVRGAAVVLIVSTIVSILLYHHFWFGQGAFLVNQVHQFFCQVAILGALFLLLAPRERAIIAQGITTLKVNPPHDH